MGDTSIARARRRLLLLVSALAVVAAGVAEQPAILGLTRRDPHAALLSAVVWLAVGAWWVTVARSYAARLPTLWKTPSALFRGGLAIGTAAIVLGRAASLAVAGVTPAAVVRSVEAALYQLGVVALASLAAFAASRSLLRPVLSGTRPPLGARDVALRTRVLVAAAASSFSTAGILLNVLIDFDVTPPDALAAYLATAAALVVSSALIGSLVGEDTARGVEEVTRRMRAMAQAHPGAPVAAPFIAADEVGDLAIAASDLERRIRREEAASAATAERERIARELHDGVAKSVSVLALDLASLAARVPEGLRPSLARVEHLSHVLAEELRAIVQEFRVRGEGEPFREAVERATQAHEAVSVELAGDLERVDALARFEVLRVLEEALRNAERHADAAHVAAQLTVDDRGLHLVVEDDGAGIGTIPWTDLAAGSHFGLLGMRERALLLGGDLSVAPRPEGGTRVALDVPLGARA